jgi:hypothetical protein
VGCVLRGRVLLRTSSASPLAAIFCLRLLLLAARAGRSALDSRSLTSREADRLAVGVLPRDARAVDAMASALAGAVGEAREVLLSMAGDAGDSSVTARSSVREERRLRLPEVSA